MPLAFLSVVPYILVVSSLSPAGGGRLPEIVGPWAHGWVLAGREEAFQTVAAVRPR